MHYCVHILHLNILRLLASDIRQVFGKKPVQPGLKSSLIEEKHILDDIFEVKSRMMVSKKNKETGEIENVWKNGVSNLYCYFQNNYSIYISM